MEIRVLKPGTEVWFFTPTGPQKGKVKASTCHVDEDLGQNFQYAVSFGDRVLQLSPSDIYASKERLNATLRSWSDNIPD